MAVNRRCLQNRRVVAGLCDAWPCHDENLYDHGSGFLGIVCRIGDVIDADYGFTGSVVCLFNKLSDLLALYVFYRESKDVGYEKPHRGKI